MAETRQKIPHLRELDLQLAVAAFGVLSKDVEDELCAIDDPEVGHPCDVVCLRWPKVAVEDQRFRIELHGADHDVLELSAAKRIPRVHAVANLQHPIGNLDPCRARELFQLSERVFGLAGASFVTHVDQDGTAVLGGDSTHPGRASEFLLERRDDLGGVFADLRVGNRTEGTKRWLIAVVDDGEVVSVVHAQGALFARREADRHDHVQVQARQVDQVVPAERLVAQVGVDQPQTSQPASAGPHAAHVGQHQLRRITHDDVMHCPPAVDENTDLPSSRVRNADQCPRELGSRKTIQGHLAPVDASQRLGFRWAQAARVAVDLQRFLSSTHEAVLARIGRPQCLARF